MALLDVVESSQERVNDLRGELDRARTALDRTDAVLAVADDTLVRAEAAITGTRRWAPVIGVAVAVALVGVVVVVILRRRGDGSDEG